ncbi:MAG: YegS/Rv2252/BmrU family lipid kinase [Chloroflexota bacterium]|nr:MAG: YegS/Rv2252/BmrU family lipid kinase [Chloroflexota bacterium]
MKLPYPRIHVVINPASGQNQPILSVLNDVFHAARVKWDVSITHQAGDAARLAKEAAASGVDLVAAYGGDGTQMEVANGLLGTGVPLAILPGGTGNAMAHELDVPLHLKGAAQLIVSSRKRRCIDLARMGDKVVMLRLYTGLPAGEAASREKKDKYGQLAYIQASLKFLTHITPAHYCARVDGEVIKVKALICFILNAGSIGGVLGISLPPIGDMNVSDGYLDLYAVTQGIQPLRALSQHLFHIGESQAGIYHWRGKEITLEADTPQDVWIDGEIDGKTPLTINVIPQALQIVVPG